MQTRFLLALIIAGVGHACHASRYRNLLILMSRHYDHIDLRVRNLAEVSEFYETLLPALGFTRDARIAGWLQYEAIAPNGGVGEFFGVTEPARHMPNENRVAFR